MPTVKSGGKIHEKTDIILGDGGILKGRSLGFRQFSSILPKVQRKSPINKKDETSLRRMFDLSILVSNYLWFYVKKVRYFFSAKIDRMRARKSTLSICISHMEVVNESRRK